MRSAILAAAVLLVGCESDAEKLERLQTERTVSCLAAQGMEQQNAANTPKGIKYASDCTLAERELNLFMSGR